MATETMVESVVDGFAVGGRQCRFGGGTVDVSFGGKARCTLDVGDGDVARDEIIGDGKVWTLMEGGLGVQGGKETTWTKEETDPVEGGVGKAMVPKEELFL